jgi:crotonobetainyl-CoA:carnitine CoA-transferase CaiB-like acyl-CoA transferase
MAEKALSRIRITDFSGVLAGAGATRILAAFGAQVIRVENPANKGAWDPLRAAPPYVDDRRGHNFGGGWNNHNVEKLGVTLNLNTEKGREIFPELVAISDIVAENFAAGVLERLGFGYEQLKAIKQDIIYLSNCGFGHWGPYQPFKTWGPIVQAFSGLTYTSGLLDQPPAGWGYSYMDHGGAYFGAIAMLAALHHRHKTGEGQHIDIATTEAASTLTGSAILDYTVNGRRTRSERGYDSNRGEAPMAPHNIYAAEGTDEWVAIACRTDEEWRALAGEIGDAAADQRYATVEGRLANRDDLEALVGNWATGQNKFEVQRRLQALGIPAAAVQTPEERIDKDENTLAWGLWPTVHHDEMGDVRVDGIPVHASSTDWELKRGAPLLGQHNREVYGGLLGMSDEEIEALTAEGVI